MEKNKIDNILSLDGFTETLLQLVKEYKVNSEILKEQNEKLEARVVELERTINELNTTLKSNELKKTIKSAVKENDETLISNFKTYVDNKVVKKINELEKTLSKSRSSKGEKEEAKPKEVANNPLPSTDELISMMPGYIANKNVKVEKKEGSKEEAK